MPNGFEFLNDFELEKRIQGMNDRELLEFAVRQAYQASMRTASNERRISDLEKRNTKFIGMVSGISTIIGGIIIAVINYFIKRS